VGLTRVQRAAAQLAKDDDDEGNEDGKKKAKVN